MKYQMWLHGGGQLNVAHALPADLGLGDLHAAAVADLALVADLLILAAVALPVLGRSEDPLAEQAVPLGLQGAVVDGLRLFHLAIGPVPDLLRRSNADFNGVKGGILPCFTPPLVIFVRYRVSDLRRASPNTSLVILVRAVLVDRRSLRVRASSVEPLTISSSVIGAVDLIVVIVVLQLDLVAVLVEHLDVQAEGLQFLDQNLEGLRHAGLGHVVPLTMAS